MEKIDFKNLPNTSTPINAENLNQVQTNVENAINGIVESGSNENGTWIKWADGTMIVNQAFTRTISTNAYENMYYNTITDVPPFPVNFTEIYGSNLTVYNNNISSAIPYSNSKTEGASIYKSCARILVYSVEKITDETAFFYVTAIGRWK